MELDTEKKISLIKRKENVQFKQERNALKKLNTRVLKIPCFYSDKRSLTWKVGSDRVALHRRKKNVVT